MIRTEITSPFGAIVDGKRTGLAGCADAPTCERSAWCLRAAAELAMRVGFLQDGRCQSFIGRSAEEITDAQVRDQDSLFGVLDEGKK